MKTRLFALACAFISTLSHSSELIVYGQEFKKQIYSEGNAVNHFGKSDIESINPNELKDILELSPNTNTASGGAKSKFVQIRSVGERSSYEGMPNSSIGLIIDDIDYTGIIGAGLIVDAEDVRIYKGPQASKYGTSALGGVIHINTLTPKKKSQGKVSQSIEENHTYKTHLQKTDKITNDLSYAISLNRNQSDGYIYNQYKKKPTQVTDEFAGKFKLQLLKENYSLAYTFHHQTQKNGYDIFNHTNTLKTQSDKPGDDDLDLNAHHLNFKKKLTDKKSLQTKIDFINARNLFAYDEDWGNNPHWNTVSGWNKNYDYNIEFHKQIKQKRIEQIYHYKNNLIGLFYKDRDESFKEKAFKNSHSRDFNKGDYELENYGIFSNNTFQISNSTQLEIGFRLENWSVQYQDLNSKFKPTDSLNGGEIIYKYSPRDDYSSHIKLAKGYKAGGVNTQKKVEEKRKEYKKEELYLLELGQSFFKEKIDFTYNVFAMYRDKIQLKSSYQDDPTDPSSYTFYTDNGTSAQIFGAESIIDYRYSSTLNFTYSLGLMKSRFNQYKLGSRDLTDRDLPHTPKYQMSLESEYKLNPQWKINYLFTLMGSYYFSNSHDQKSRRREISNLSLHYRKKAYGFQFFVKNLFNAEGSDRGYFFSNEPPAWEEKLYTQGIRPQHIGVKFTYEY